MHLSLPNVKVSHLGGLSNRAKITNGRNLERPLQAQET
jgi:hypothetical protein